MLGSQIGAEGLKKVEETNDNFSWYAQPDFLKYESFIDNESMDFTVRIK